MSDLDYEDEANESASTRAAEQSSSVESFQDPQSTAENSEIPKDVQENSEEGEVESDAGELSNSDRDLADLEEGEINDENTDGNNLVVCRFFQNGNCRYGKQCRFVHTGASAYKMFDSRIHTRRFHLAIPQQYIYYNQSKVSSPPMYSERNGDNAWEQGLEEAKKLLLIARDKKETDVEFEDKKLYLQTEEETEIDRKADIRKKDKKKHSKSKKSKMKYKSSPSEYSKKETKVKRRKNHSKPDKLSNEIWTDPWRRSRSRTRNRSRSSSSSSFSSRHWSQKSCCSSICSLCSSDDGEHPSKSRTSKPKSKLQRVFSRTFSRSRSRRRSRSRSKSCSAASLKRSLYRSYSRSRSSSSSGSWCSRKSSIQKALAKSVSNRTSPNASKISPSFKQRKRKLSPESQSSNHWRKETASSGWDSSSSDLTVSSITCTTFSGTRSSVDSGSVKRAKAITSSKRSGHSDEMFLENYKRNHSERDSTYKKCQDEDCPPVLMKPKSGYKPDFSEEITCRKTFPGQNSLDSNKKHDGGGIPADKKPEKINVSEMELFKYLPSRKRLPAVERKKKPSAKSIEAITEPKKVISISLKPTTKFVPTKSVLSSPVHNSPPKEVNKPLSRREQLLRQLEAVELAIAKKKRNS